MENNWKIICTTFPEILDKGSKKLMADSILVLQLVVNGVGNFPSKIEEIIFISVVSSIIDKATRLVITFNN